MNRKLTLLFLGALVLALAVAVVPGRRDLPVATITSTSRTAGTRDVPWNIVVIVMDTARQDRLSCYGYERETSPRLTRLAESATVYLNAYSTSSWTAPGHASLFTGLHSVSHGVTQENWNMSEDLITFAEVLAERGYRTVGVVENPMLVSDRGYAQGFSEYYESWHTGSWGRSGRAVDDFPKALDGGAPGQPFLIFVNLIAPHSPYNSSRQFRDSFVTRPEIRVDRNFWREYYTGRRSFSQDELQHLNELYDAELLYTDHLVGEMIDELVARNLWDDTVLMVTSDHGENIGDHAHMDHVFTLFETTTKIPLIVHQPELFPAGLTKDVPVQLTDVFPTVLEIAGVDIDDFPSHGYSLLGMAVPEDREVFAEYYHPTQVLSCYGKEELRQSPLLKPYMRRIRSITRGDMKFIWGSDERHELYDLAHDPGELINLIESEAHAGARHDMEVRLTAWFQELERDREDEPHEDDSEKLDEATKEALRSLGYLE
ncbi:MAG: sulfatase [Candidatus Eisenbacteria bacterium]